MAKCKLCKNQAVYKWRAENPEKHKTIIRRHYNTGRTLELKKQKYWEDPEKHRRQCRTNRAKPGAKEVRAAHEKTPQVKAYRKLYKAQTHRVKRDRELNKRPHVRERTNARARHRRNTDPKFKLHATMSNQVYLCVSKKRKSWLDFVDYTLEELMMHLEKQFVKGMNWNNYGKYGWHIDHIIPASSFNMKEAGDSEFKACWNLSNLRPLWAEDNYTKHAKRLFLL